VRRIPITTPRRLGDHPTRFVDEVLGHSWGGLLAMRDVDAQRR
jgi:hypothetical protein